MTLPDGSSGAMTLPDGSSGALPADTICLACRFRYLRMHYPVCDSCFWNHLHIGSGPDGEYRWYPLGDHGLGPHNGETVVKQFGWPEKVSWAAAAWSYWGVER
jgi:hypothetical protein